MIRELDSDGDRYIDLDEFMDAIIECGSKEDELMDAFLIFDVDKNGFISAKELQRVQVISLKRQDVHWVWKGSGLPLSIFTAENCSPEEENYNYDICLHYFIDGKYNS
ncbi:hypothetical protein DKX38_000858 [Salix brachista]|uniref:EF-hand domain-containing protein n=1 Tax=Salix brachista TaxID=2182728 RepID=A0A5N5P1N4_9ROSI|nr:hypothetical protein DKX38_000858 [Salix brachista]